MPVSIGQDYIIRNPCTLSTYVPEFTGVKTQSLRLRWGHGFIVHCAYKVYLSPYTSVSSQDGINVPAES